MLLMQHQVAKYVHAPERHRLRYRPLHGATGWRDSQTLKSAPERAGRIVARKAGIGMYVADNVNGLGNIAETHHLCVETNRDIDPILAGQKEEGVAVRAEFAVLLPRVDFVDLLLNLRCGHGGIEHQNIWAELRR